MSAVAVAEPSIVADQRAELQRSGMVRIPRALNPEGVTRARRALDRIHREEIAGGRVAAGDPMHVLGGIGRDDSFLDLVDHPGVLPVIWGELGWNIHVYHCHLDLTPPRRAPRDRAVWRWHQDGGRQNLELDRGPRARMSLKVVFWLSDVSEPGRGNMLVVPNSHECDTLARRRRAGGGFVEPPGARPVLAQPGDALIFDRRLWHSRSDNLSSLTRKAVFLAYTYRWVRPRDDLGIDPASARFRRLSPIRRQLLGEGGEPRSYWGLGGESIPLRVTLDRMGLLDPLIPSHR